MKTFLLLCALISSGLCFSQRFRIDDNKLVLTEPVSFKPSSSQLLPESETVLKAIKLFLDEKSFISLIRVEAHVALDDAAQSQSLSEQRAQAVVKWLVKEGVDCKRLLAAGFGDTKPVVAKDAPDKAQNTRIVFAVASLRGRAIGGLPTDGGGKVVSEACQ